jgi:hypothetical protein
MFKEKGGVHTTPADFPLIKILATSNTSPKFILMTLSFVSDSREISKLFLYVAVPEKYFMPSSVWSVQEMSLVILTESGAPHFSGKDKVQGEFISWLFVSFMILYAGSIRLSALNTIKQDALGASCRLILVFPFNVFRSII